MARSHIVNGRCVDERRLVVQTYRRLLRTPRPTAKAIREAITAERLETAIYGRGPDGRPRTFEKAYFEVFGEKL